MVVDNLQQNVSIFVFRFYAKKFIYFNMLSTNKEMTGIGLAYSMTELFSFDLYKT